jgi:LPS sulfotransferase NodH
LRFVILSMARSGTSLLSSTLNTHPAILCHGEIFHPEPRWHLLGNLEQLSDDEKRRLQAQPDFVERVYAQDRPVVGHKMWYDQNPAVCDTLMADETISKIIYERENALAQFASGQLAYQTGIWDKEASDGTKLTNVPSLQFIPAQFNQFIAFRTETFQRYHSQSRGPVLNLTYRDIAEGHFDIVLRFLGQAPVPLQPQKKKLYSSDIISRYRPEDHDLIRSHLAAMGHPEWASE